MTSSYRPISWGCFPGFHRWWGRGITADRPRDGSESPLLWAPVDPTSTKGGDSPCINCTAIILESLRFLLMYPVWFPFDLHSCLIEMVFVISYLMWFIISSAAFCLQWLEVFLTLTWETFMSSVFSQGLVLLALSVVEISFANQKCTERVSVLLSETASSSSMPLSPVTSMCLGGGGKSLSLRPQWEPRRRSGRPVCVCSRAVLIMCRELQNRAASALRLLASRWVMPQRPRCLDPQKLLMSNVFRKSQKLNQLTYNFLFSSNSAQPCMASGSFCGSYSSFILRGLM